ncbi:MAG: hotdog fold thioesterase [Reyranella sp.]|uniref:hotdog fold thioesterase n=1 Tax=Reyranella sp. TaxID=1929291 RepID=UPI00121D7248|nr:hotdog fold thioesterase [Reyranella sp.]TAJ89134.1 MAG: hotdog fold thioesterase [Reyranella sp.]
MIDVSALARRDTFARTLGVDLVEASLGRAVTRVAIEERHLNFNGVGHGGLTFTLADAAFGYACNSQGVVSGSIDAHIVYSVAVRLGDVLTATAVEISRSSKASTYRIDVVRGDGKLVAAMTGTALISGKPVVV